MTTRFADTSFYVAICNPRDSLHARALELMQDFEGTVVTTEYVLVEVANFFSQVGGREVFVELLATLRQDASVVIVPSSAAIFDRGHELFAARLDKSWSLTDCISFVAMSDANLRDALTADHHFEQAGFRALLSSEK